jgi:hypothetical protein
METNTLFSNPINMEFQCKNVNLEKVILVEIILEYCDILKNNETSELNESINQNLDLYRHCAKLYVPKEKIAGSFIENELQKTGGNYMKVFIK